MTYVLRKGKQLRLQYVACDLRLRIALECNIAVTRAVLPSFCVFVLCATATYVHTFALFWHETDDDLYSEVCTRSIGLKKQKAFQYALSDGTIHLYMYVALLLHPYLLIYYLPPLRRALRQMFGGATVKPSVDEKTRKKTAEEQKCEVDAYFAQYANKW